MPSRTQLFLSCVLCALHVLYVSLSIWASETSALQAELCNALATSIAIDDRPSCFRFPRGNGIGVDLAAYGVAPNLKGTAWEVGLALAWRCAVHLFQVLRP